MNNKWKGPGLRTRIFAILTALILITLTGGSVMMWYTFRMEALFTDVINMDLAALRAAEELQTALVNQKGFVTYYYLDGNPEWLKKLEEYHRIFKGWFAEALKSSRTENSKAILKEIDSEYNRYIDAKRKVVSLYQAGERQKGAKLHDEVRGKFFKILELCEKYKDIHNKRIELIRQKSRRQAERLRIIAGTAMTTALSLGVLLAFILVIQILNPIRRLAQYVDTTGGAAESRNEVTTLKRRVRGLIEDFDMTSTELERSRERLLQSEKMAMIGKLAAEVAHSIRNPMTSIKMRLFSLERNLNLTPSQQEDLEVISKEMRNLDNIVRNFLEFARPPKLKKQSINISEIVDMTLQLLRSR
ncbi:MAG: histidine kinase dimerization/phospho-acceptor domain-containing protein, partial [bacterium]